MQNTLTITEIMNRLGDRYLTAVQAREAAAELQAILSANPQLEEMEPRLGAIAERIAKLTA